MDDQPKLILPTQGLWTIEALAKYLELPAPVVQEKLSEFGVTVMSFSSRYKHKMFRLENLEIKKEAQE